MSIPFQNNLIGIHSMVFSPKWDKDGATRACKGAKQAGFDTIEISLMPLEIDCEMTVELLREYELTPTCSLGLTFDTDISSLDEQVRCRGEEVLNRALDIASKIGAPYLCGVLYSCLNKYSVPSTEENLKHSGAILKRLCERAKPMGVTIGLEPCNRYETNLLNTTSATVKFIENEMGGVDNALVHLDTYHMNIEERYEDAVSGAGTRAGYLHMGECHRGQLGSGNIDFDRVFAALAKADYKGPIVFESFSKDIMHEGVISALAIWRRLWKIEDAEELAVNARKFIGNLIQTAQGTK